MAAKETPPPAARQNTLYHGTMIDLTDAPDDPIDLTEDDDDVQLVPNESSPQKQSDQTPTPTKPSEEEQPQVVLNHRLNVYSSVSAVHLPPPAPTVTFQSQQAKVNSPTRVATQPTQAKTSDKFILKKPTEAKSINKPPPPLLQKPALPALTKPLSDTSQTTKPSQLIQKPPMARPSPLLEDKSAQVAAWLNSGPNKLDTNKVLTKIKFDVSKMGWPKPQKSNAERIREQLACLRKTQDESRGTTAPHVNPTTQQTVARPRNKNAVWPKLNLYDSEGAAISHDNLQQQQPVVGPVEPDVQQSGPAQRVAHVPVLAPCLDTSGQYVLLPTAMLRQMMIPIENTAGAMAQPYFVMPNMPGAQPTPIVVQNVENQSNYIKSVVNTAPAVSPPPPPPVKTATPAAPPPKQVVKISRPFRKTDQHMTMQISSGIVNRQLDVHRQDIEVPFVDFVGSQLSFVDLTSTDDNPVKQEEDEEQVTGESIDLTYPTDGIAADPLDDTALHLPETVVLDTVIPIDIGTILQQPSRTAAPLDEWCYETELSPECHNYTMRGDKFIGFPRLERERHAVCADIVTELFADNLRGMLKHKKLLRDLDMQVRQRLRAQAVSERRGQFKKPDAFARPKETPFLPRKNRPNFLPPKQDGKLSSNETHASSDDDSSDEDEPIVKKRGRPRGSTSNRGSSGVIPKKNAPSTSTGWAGAGPSKQMESQKKYVVSKEVYMAVKRKDVAEDIPPAANVPVKRAYKKRNAKRKGPPPRPRVEAMTDADNPLEEPSDLFLVKKVQILNKDHDVVTLKYNPNCV